MDSVLYSPDRDTLHGAGCPNSSQVQQLGGSVTAWCCIWTRYCIALTGILYMGPAGNTLNMDTNTLNGFSIFYRQQHNEISHKFHRLLVKCTIQYMHTMQTFYQCCTFPLKGQYCHNQSKLSTGHGIGVLV